MIRHCTIILLALLLSCESDPISSNRVFKGVVSTASPEATKAGYDILLQGGNAIDAAVAVSFVLAVTEPAMSGLGGGTQVLLALPNQSPVSINGTTFSPDSTPRNLTKDELRYHRRSSIPSTVKTLDFIWKKYGSGKIGWPKLLEAAIDYAENGFVVGNFRHKVYKKYEGALKRSTHNTHFFLMPDGSIPAPGDTLRQPILAKTLRQLAEHGAKDFYQGKIAELIAEDMKNNEAWIDLEDLNNFPEPKELSPVHTTYRGFDVYSQPPPCGGWTALLVLNLLEESKKEDLVYGSITRFHHLSQALHLAHKNRKEAPIENMEDYSKAVGQKISKAYAHELLSGKKMGKGIQIQEESGGETTHFSIVDKDEMAVSVTASINAYFGAKAASSKLGFLYNTYMNDFELGDTSHPFAIGPNKMAYSSMSPTIVQKNGSTRLVLGSPGSARIISTVAQLTQLWIDSDLGIEEIVSSARLHAVNGKIYVEAIENIPNSWLTNMRKHNFEIAFPSYDLKEGALNPYFGGVHAIAKESGVWVGTADPRRDGSVMK